MSAFRMRHAAAAALTATILLGAASSAAYAEIRDYEFRLVNKKSGKAVPDAVIFAKRIDMAPEGMATMASPLEQLPSAHVLIGCQPVLDK